MSRIVQTNYPYGERPDYEDLQVTEVPDIWQFKVIDNVKFIWGDNIQYLRWLKDNLQFKFFDIGIVDPPYGISVGDMKLGATANSKPRDYEMGEWDGEVPNQEYWDLLNYVCKELIVWGGNYFTVEYGRCTKNDAPFPIKAGRGFYVWDKKNNGMSFADCELALTTMDFSARIIGKSRAMKEDDGKKRHPTHKPAYLYEYLHLQHDLKGKKVLDTHGGSFSHAIASYKTGALLTIVEKNKSYCISGIEAFKQASVKGRLAF